MTSFTLTLTNYKLHEKIRWLHLWSSQRTRKCLGGAWIICIIYLYIYAQICIKMIISSVICIYDTRSDRFYPCLGMYLSKHRPSRTPSSCVFFLSSRRSKATTSRLHRRESGWLHSNGNHTWLIYWIICPIRRLMSKFETYFIWRCDAFEKSRRQMKEDSNLDAKR